jgi:hypothetical protein
MNPVQPGGLRRNAAADLWRNTLSQISTNFGKLVYLSSLRDSNTGQYHHHGLAALFGDQESELALRRSHTEIFEKWLNLPLQNQKEDLDEYLSSLEQERRVVIEAWTKLTPYQTLAPESAQPVEKDLFISDMEAALGLLRAEFGVTKLGD